MGRVLALVVSAWLGLEGQGGPSIAGRVLDAQTGEPVAGAATTAAASGEASPSRRPSVCRSSSER